MILQCVASSSTFNVSFDQKSERSRYGSTSLKPIDFRSIFSSRLSLVHPSMSSHSHPRILLRSQIASIAEVDAFAAALLLVRGTTEGKMRGSPDLLAIRSQRRARKGNSPLVISKAVEIIPWCLLMRSGAPGQLEIVLDLDCE